MNVVIKTLEHLYQNSYFIFYIIFFFSFLLRYNIGYDSSLWLDEAWRIASARDYEFSSFYSFWKLSFQFESLLRLNDFLLVNSTENYRIFFVVISSLTPPFLYFLSLRFLSNGISIIIALILAVSSWHITYSNELAAYSVAATFLLIFCLLIFLEKKSFYHYFSIFLCILVLGWLHLYLIGLILIFFSINYLIKYFISKDTNELKKIVFITSSILLLFSGKIYHLFFEFSTTEALSNQVSTNWILLFPINLANLILPGPFPDRWIPTAYDAGNITQFFALIIAFILFASIAKYFFHALKKITFNNFIKSFQDHSPFLIILLTTFFYIFFIYIQAFKVTGEFYRYLLPVLPLILLSIFFILDKLYKKRSKYVVAIGFALIMLNLLVIKNSNFSTHFKNPYASIFEEVSAKCDKQNVVIITPSFLELSIVKFYLNDSSCQLITQPSYNNFFKLHQKNLAYQNKIQMDAEDIYLIGQIKKNGQTPDLIYLLGARSIPRIERLLTSNELSNYTIDEDKLSFYKPAFRTVLLKKL